MSIVAIIQARMGSKRLPGKVLLELNGKTVLEFMVDRVSESKYIKDVIVATSENDQDDIIFNLCKSKKIICLRGSEENVIKRVVSAIDEYDHYHQSDKISLCVDLTGDCPLVCPSMIDHLIELQIENDYDYISNDVVDRSWPDGLDIQVYKPNALKETFYVLITNPIHFSHSGWNICKYGQKKFRIKHWIAPEKYYMPEVGLTLDEREDYDVIKNIVSIFGNKENYKQPFTIYPVLDYIILNNDILTNKHIQRKEPGTG